MSVSELKISLVQSNPTVGRMEFNAEFLLEKANEAVEKGSDMIIFMQNICSRYGNM